MFERKVGDQLVVLADGGADGRHHRAAIGKDYKLIANLRSNTYQLFDRRSDPWENSNIYTQNAGAAEKMKKALDDWLERVFAARDASNQSFQKVQQDILSEPPKSMTPASAKWMNAIELIGYEVVPKTAHPGDKLTVTCYFRSIRSIAQSLRMEVWALGDNLPDPVSPPPKPPGRTPPGAAVPPRPAPPPVRPMSNGSIIFGGGFNLTSSWHPGDIVRQAVELQVPVNAPRSKVTLVVKLTDDANNRQAVGLSSGPGTDATLGEVSLGGLAPAPAPAPKRP